MIKSETIREQPFTAKDLREAAGLTYRQLHDWDKKGVMPRSQGRDKQWRKFTIREVFSIMVCSEIRRRFGVPLEHLASVLSRLLEATPDPLEIAVRQMSEIGAGVWFRTDLNESAEIFPVTRFEQTTVAGTFFDGSTDSMILLRLDPIVNRLLKHIDDSRPVSTHLRGLDEIRDAHKAVSVKSPEEFELLEIIRRRELKKVEVTLKGGKIQTFRMSRNVDVKTAEVEQFVKEGGYQKIEIHINDGTTVSYEQTVTKRPED